MYFIEKPVGEFVDRKLLDNTLQSIDVIMLTLDAGFFLEKSLFSVFKEIPVNNLIICDGGSKDKTVEILKKFPRTEIYVKPEIKTTGKALEFLFSNVKTEWFVIIDSDIELEEGWYSKMLEHSNVYDVIENGKRINAYHFYREQKSKLEEDKRSLDFCHLVRKESVKEYHCDDDYMWRFTDILFRQEIEDKGYKYGKVNTTLHVHHETERIPYQSDNEKNFQEIKFSEPEIIINNQKKLEQLMIKHAKAAVKYLDPDYPMVKNDRSYEKMIGLLEREWIEENGVKWLKRYDAMSSKSFMIRGRIRKILSNLKHRKMR